MKAVFIAYLRGFGGAQRQIINVANAMSERGHDVTIISLSDNKKCYDINPEIKVLYIKDSGIGFTKILNRYKKLKKILLQQKPNVVINFWFQSVYLTAPMKRKMGFKIIYSERSDPDDKQYHGMLGIIRKFSLDKIDGFVFQTNAAKSYFNQSVQRKSVVIPNAVLIREPNRKKISKKKDIVTVGRLHEQKNIPLLINAFSELEKEYPDYKLLIYGDGELKEQLQEYIDSLGLSDKIKLCGATKNVHDKINNAKMFVLSSDYEGMPNALIEAMILGLPCISTNWKPGGVFDIIKDGKNGLIVPRNNKEELYLAMKMLIENQNLSEVLAGNAKKDAIRYSPERLFDSWERFLLSVVGSKK